MMKALDADAVRRAVCNVDIPACVTEDQFYAVMNNVCAPITKLKPVEAVPLEPLCMLLHDIVEVPCYRPMGEDKCAELLGEGRDCTGWGEQECWEHFLRAWMKETEDSNGP